MGIENEKLVEKAQIATAAIAAAGKLNDAQSDRFLDYVEDESVLKEFARMVRFRNEKMKVEKLNVHSRVALPAVEGVDPGHRRGVTPTVVSLEPKEIIVPFTITDSFFENNLEGKDVEDLVIKMMAKQTSNDTEIWSIHGNTLTPAAIENDILEGGSSSQYVADGLLGLRDGWLRHADGANLVNIGNTAIGASTFTSMMKAMPTKYRRRRSELRWLMSSDLWLNHIERLQQRATALGDRASEGLANNPLGVKALELPLMDFLPRTVKHVTLTGTTAVSLDFTNISNVVVTPSTLDDTPTTPYVGGGTDYTVDTATGMINREAGGAISSGQLVKVTFGALPQMLLTNLNNLIWAVGRDIRIEKDRKPMARRHDYVITAKVDFQFEELNAIVKGYNIAQTV